MTTRRRARRVVVGLAVLGLLASLVAPAAAAPVYQSQQEQITIHGEGNPDRQRHGRAQTQYRYVTLGEGQWTVNSVGTLNDVMGVARWVQEQVDGKVERRKVDTAVDCAATFYGVTVFRLSADDADCRPGEWRLAIDALRRWSVTFLRVASADGVIDQPPVPIPTTAPPQDPDTPEEAPEEIQQASVTVSGPAGPNRYRPSQGDWQSGTVKLGEGLWTVSSVGTQNQVTGVSRLVGTLVNGKYKYRRVNTETACAATFEGVTVFRLRDDITDCEPGDDWRVHVAAIVPWSVTFLRVASADMADMPPPVTPEITVAAGPDVNEGQAASFTLTADPAPSSPLTVTVEVTAAGDFGATVGMHAVAVGTAGTATLTVATVDDSVDEVDGSITATVTVGSGYTIGAAATATANVSDDDDPPPAVVEPEEPEEPEAELPDENTEDRQPIEFNGEPADDGSVINRSGQADKRVTRKLHLTKGRWEADIRNKSSKRGGIRATLKHADTGRVCKKWDAKSAKRVSVDVRIGTKKCPAGDYTLIVKAQRNWTATFVR